MLCYHYVKQAIPTFTMSCEFEGCVYAIEKDEEMLMIVAEGLLEIHHRNHERGYIYTKEGFTMPGQTPQKEVVIKPPTEVA